MGLQTQRCKAGIRRGSEGLQWQCSTSSKSTGTVLYVQQLIVNSQIRVLLALQIPQTTTVSRILRVNDICWSSTVKHRSQTQYPWWLLLCTLDLYIQLPITPLYPETPSMPSKLNLSSSLAKPTHSPITALPCWLLQPNEPRGAKSQVLRAYLPKPETWESFFEFFLPTAHSYHQFLLVLSHKSFWKLSAPPHAR